MTVRSSLLSIGCNWSLWCKRRVVTPLRSCCPSWLFQRGRTFCGPRTPEALLSLPVGKRGAALTEINKQICRSKSLIESRHIQIPRRRPGSRHDWHKTCYQLSCFHNSPFVDTHRRRWVSPERLGGSGTYTADLKRKISFKTRQMYNKLQFVE